MKSSLARPYPQPLGREQKKPGSALGNNRRSDRHLPAAAFTRFAAHAGDRLSGYSRATFPDRIPTVKRRCRFEQPGVACDPSQFLFGNGPFTSSRPKPTCFELYERIDFRRKEFFRQRLVVNRRETR